VAGKEGKGQNQIPGQLRWGNLRGLKDLLRVQQGNRHDVTLNLIRSVMENISVTAFAFPNRVNDVTVLVKCDRSLPPQHTHTQTTFLNLCNLSLQITHQTNPSGIFRRQMQIFVHDSVPRSEHSTAGPYRFKY